MLTVRLNGILGERFIPEIKLDVTTVKEAIRALEANFPSFRHFMIHSGGMGIVYKVVLSEWEMGEADLYAPCGSGVLTITPVPAASGAIGKIIAGVVLVAVGVLTGGAGFALAGAFISIGLSLVLSGIVGLFNKPPSDSGEDEENKPSFIFNGGANTVTAGGRVPLVFGELIVGSQTVSAQIRVYTDLDESPDED